MSKPWRPESPPLLTVVGPSGAGKTTLCARLLRELQARGKRVAAIKHCGGPYEFDREGKDSYRLRQAGAAAVIVAGHRMVACFREVPADPPIEELLPLLPSPLDLVVIEGYSDERLPRIEVLHPERSEGLLVPPDEHLLAVVGRCPDPMPVPVFSREAIPRIADLIQDHLHHAPPDRAAERGERVLRLLCSGEAQES